MASSCWFFRALWLSLLLVAAVADEQLQAGCWGSPNRCGGINISHPFWLRDNEAERACGLSDFEVNCYNKSVPVLRSSMPFGFGFAIVGDINYEQRSLRVVDVGKLILLLTASNSCQVPIWNTSAKLGVQFRIEPVNLNLVLYNCTEEAGAAALARRRRELVQTRMRCGNRSKVYARAGGLYNGTSGYGRYEGCNAAVMPVRGLPSGEANARDYERLINDGFLLTWERPPTRKFLF